MKHLLKHMIACALVTVNKLVTIIASIISLFLLNLLYRPRSPEIINNIRFFFLIKSKNILVKGDH